MSTIDKVLNRSRSRKSRLPARGQEVLSHLQDYRVPIYLHKRQDLSDQAVVWNAVVKAPSYNEVVQRVRNWRKMVGQKGIRTMKGGPLRYITMISESEILRLDPGNRVTPLPLPEHVR